MARSLVNLALGVFFLCCFVLLRSVSSNIFRTSSPLSTPIAYVFIFIGETITTIPLIPFAWRHWTVTKPKRWALFFAFAFMINIGIILWRSAAAVMPLSAYSAISCSGVLFSPFLMTALRRQCIEAVDVGGVIAVTIGLLLVTHPPFLFGVPFSAPFWSYLFAFFHAVTAMMTPFFYGAIADEHWSNFLVFRWIFSSAIAVVCFGVADFSGFSSAPSTALVAVTLVGGISTIYRLAQQVGCAELEEFEESLAGIFGNVLRAGSIATTTLMAMAFFGEIPTALETVGVVVIFVAIIVVTLLKGKKKEETGEKDYVP